MKYGTISYTPCIYCSFSTVLMGVLQTNATLGFYIYLTIQHTSIPKLRTQHTCPVITLCRNIPTTNVIFNSVSCVQHLGVSETSFSECALSQHPNVPNHKPYLQWLSMALLSGISLNEILVWIYLPLQCCQTDQSGLSPYLYQTWAALNPQAAMKLFTRPGVDTLCTANSLI